MSTEAGAIIRDIEKGQFAPVYFLCGEETYYIDQIESAILKYAFQPGEADFNLDILYAKDIQGVNDIVNACQVYPAFAQRRVVILREAQQFNKPEQWKAMEAYLQQPTLSTVLVVCHKHKVPDKRTSFAKLLEKKTVYLAAEKLKEHQVASWIKDYVNKRAYKIDDTCAQLLADNLGSDVSRIVNEIDKLELALDKGVIISQEIIEKYIGISRDYNNLELSNAIQNRDVVKAITILKYFENNPKAGPAPLIIGTLYSFFIKMWQLYQLSPEERKNDADIARALGMAPFMATRFKQSMRHYSAAKSEQAIALLTEYDGRTKGINSRTTPESALMKELVYKLMH